MKTRVCSQCKEEKLLTKDFFNTRDKLQKKFRTDCKICQRLKQSKAYQKKREYYKNATKKRRQKLRASNQKLLWEFLKNNGCIRCGENNPVVLEMDHLGNKKYCISDIIYCHTWESVLTEIEKCQILCANCHRKKTAKDFKWYQFIDGIEQFL